MSKKISDLTSATTPLAGTELVEIVQGGTSKKVAASYLVGAAGAREVLGANRTYYVRTDGSDSNDGLANTSGGAFLTIQKAINVVSGTLDVANYDVTVQVADGTYTGAIVGKKLVGAGKITIKGNTSTPANVHINVTGAAVSVSEPGDYLKIIYCKITGSTYGLFAIPYGIIEYGNIVFGASSSSQIFSAYHAHINCLSAYTISGGATNHIEISTGGTFRSYGVLVTLTGTPSFTNYLKAIGGAAGYLETTTYSGSATGARYSVSLNAVVMSGGATLPGNSAGTTATGGQYS